MLKGKKAGGGGAQVSVLAKILNIQSIVNRTQVEADCCKEEARNRL